MKLFTNNKSYNELQFEKEADFEREVVLNSKQFFGVNSIYIDAKRKIETKSLGNSIPDGFLFSEIESYIKAFASNIASPIFATITKKSFLQLHLYRF